MATTEHDRTEPEGEHGAEFGLVLPRLVRRNEAAAWLSGYGQAKGFAARLRAALVDAGVTPPRAVVTATVDDHGQPLVCVAITPGGFAATLSAATRAGLGQPVRGHPPSPQPETAQAGPVRAA